MLHMRLKVVDLPTLGMPTRPARQASLVAILHRRAKRGLGCRRGYQPWRVSVGVRRPPWACGLTRAEGCRCRGQTPTDRSVACLHIVRGAAQQHALPLLLPRQRWACVSQDGALVRCEELCRGSPPSSWAALHEFTCHGRKDTQLQGLRVRARVGAGSSRGSAQGRRRRLRASDVLGIEVSVESTGRARVMTATAVDGSHLPQAREMAILTPG